MKKASFIIVLFILVSCAYAQETANQNISFAVKNSLLQWLEKIPSGDEANYGFQNREEFSRAGLGSPIQMFKLNDILYGSDGKVNPMKPTGEWKIPVTVDEQNRALVTVMKRDLEWSIVDLGAAGLARELNDFKSKLTAEQFRDIKMLRVYQVESDFLFYDAPSSSADEIVLVPMQSASHYLEGMTGRTKKTLTLEEVTKFVSESILLNHQD